jgi:hypothetical protein
MAIADNPIEVRLQQAKEGLDADIGRDLAGATIATPLHGERSSSPLSASVFSNL